MIKFDTNMAGRVNDISFFFPCGFSRCGVWFRSAAIGGFPKPLHWTDRHWSDRTQGVPDGNGRQATPWRSERQEGGPMDEKTGSRWRPEFAFRYLSYAILVGIIRSLRRFDHGFLEFIFVAWLARSGTWREMR